MSLPRVRFTIRSLIIAVALVAFNLAGAVASPRKDWSVVGRVGGGPGFVHNDWIPEYNFTCEYEGNELGSLERELLPLSFVQAWSPIIASVSITLLILTVRFWYWGTFNRSTPARPGGATLTRWSRERLARRLMAIIIAMTVLTLVSHFVRPIAFVFRLAITVVVLSICLCDWGERWERMWLLARWAIVVIALIAVNLVSAVAPPPWNLYETRWSDRLPRPPRGFIIRFVGDYRLSPPLPTQPIEPPPGTQLDLGYGDLFVGIPRVLNLSIDATLVQRRAMKMDWRKRLPEVLFQDTLIGEATIDFRADGSIVSYTGRPGKRLSPPRVLRPPSFSFLELRWPVIASASLTCLFLVVTVRRLSRQQIRTLVIVVALACINLAGAYASRGMEQPRLLSSTWGGGPSEEYYSDGSRHIDEWGPGIPWRVIRIERLTPPPTFLESWWPIMTGTGITFLVVPILLWRRVRWP